MKTLRFIPISIALLAAVAANAQNISISPSALSLSGLVGGSSVSQLLNITATSSNTTVAVLPSQSWLSVSPTSGTTPLQVTVTANPAGLSAGTYSDNNFRVVTSTQTITVPVTFTVGSITVTPTSLSFAYTLGNPTNPLGQILTVNGQIVNFTVAATTTTGGNWLQATPLGSNQVNVLVNPIVLASLTAGTYQGAVTVTPTNSLPVNVPVTLTVSPEPPVTVSPSSVNLNYQIGGLNNQGGQAVTLATTSATALPYIFGTPSVNPNPSGGNWILVSPTSGTIPAGGNTQATVSYITTTNLPAGSYSGTVPVTATGGLISTSSLPVNLFVSSSPLLIVPTQALNFTYEIGGAQPAAQNVTPQSTAVLPASTTGQMPITVSAATTTGGNWLSVSPAGNLATGTPFAVITNPTGLLPGSYTGTVTVTPATGAVSGNGAQTIAVTLVVANDPAIVANTNGITFPYQIGQTAPGTQTINLTSSTGALLNYSVTSAETSCSTVNWLTLGGNTTGSTNGSFTVTPANLASLTAGTCAGTITVTATNPATGNAAISSPLAIPVTLYVSSTPLLVATPTSLTFTSAVSGAGSTQQILVTSTDPNTTLTYTVTQSTNSGGNNWLAVTPLSANTAAGNNIVNVFVNPGLLSAGTYTGTVTIASTGVADSPITIPVTLVVTSGSLTLSSNSLSFAYTVSGSNPVAQTVQVTSSGAALNFTAAPNSGIAGTSWLSVTPTSGTTPGSLSISANGTGLTPGNYTGTVVVTSPNAGNSPATINVTFAVNSGTITATPAPTAAGLTFIQPGGGAAPAAQTITLTGTPGPINFTAAAITATGGNWLSVTPASGTTPGTVSISANAGTLPIGTYTGTVTITAPGATGSPFTYGVTLSVVTPITITATPSALSFGYTLNATAPTAQTVQITAAGPPGVGTLATFPFTATAATTDGGKWLSVTPTTGTVPGSIAVSIVPTGLAVGNYTGTVTIASGNQNGATPATVTVKLAVTTAPTPAISAVTNAASGFVGAISPGEEVAIYGTNFGPAGVVSAPITGNAYPTTLSNTQVLFDGVPAPIIAVANGQVNVMVPYGIAGRASTMVQVSYLGVSSPGIAYNVTATVPGIYTVNQAGTGQGAILNQDLSLNNSSKPAEKGSVIAIYMTGEGVTSPPSVTGQLAPSDGSGLNHPALTVTATVGGLPAQVQYYGSAPGLVYGVMQVNVLIPATASSGAQPVVVTVGTANSQSGVTVAIQ